MTSPNRHYRIVAGELLALAPKPMPSARLNKVTWQWEDPRTLADLKAAKWAAIKLARDVAEYGGIEWDGSVFDSDATSQNRIAGAVTLAQMDPGFSIAWVLADNSTRTLNQADMVGLGIAVGQHVAGCFAHSQALRDQVATASTPAEVEAVPSW